MIIEFDIIVHTSPNIKDLVAQMVKDVPVIIFSAVVVQRFRIKKPKIKDEISMIKNMIAVP